MLSVALSPCHPHQWVIGEEGIESVCVAEANITGCPQPNPPTPTPSHIPLLLSDSLPCDQNAPFPCRQPPPRETLWKGEPHTLSGMDTHVMALPIFAARIYGHLSPHLHDRALRSRELWAELVTSSPESSRMLVLTQRSSASSETCGLMDLSFHNVFGETAMMWKNYEEEVQRKKRKLCRSSTFLNDPRLLQLSKH